MKGGVKTVKIFRAFFWWAKSCGLYILIPKKNEFLSMNRDKKNILTIERTEMRKLFLLFEEWGMKEADLDYKIYTWPWDVQRHAFKSKGDIALSTY